MRAPVLHLTILGPPRTKKNHSRIIEVRGKPRVIPSRQHEGWFHGAVLQVRAQWAGFGERTITIPCSVAATFYRDRATGDLVNYIQALADLLQAAHIVDDDKRIVNWDGSRLDVDRRRPRIELELRVG
jgi:Holliday junction resolvase RusA-like endonuclease